MKRKKCKYQRKIRRVIPESEIQEEPTERMKDNSKKESEKECANLFWIIYGLNLKDEEILKLIKSFDIIVLTEAGIERKKQNEMTKLWSQCYVEKGYGRNSSRKGRSRNQKQSVKNEEEKEGTRLDRDMIGCSVISKDTSSVNEKLGQGTVYLSICFDNLVTFFEI